MTGLQLCAHIILRTVLQYGITLYFISMQKMQQNQILIPQSPFGHIAVNSSKTLKVFVQSCSLSPLAIVLGLGKITHNKKKKRGGSKLESNSCCAHNALFSLLFFDLRRAFMQLVAISLLAQSQRSTWAGVPRDCRATQAD